MVSRKVAVLAFTLSFAAWALPSPAQSDSQLHINQIQVIGSHNSYHAGIAPNEMKIWLAKNPDAFKGLDYQHQPSPSSLTAASAKLSSTSMLTARAASTRTPTVRTWLKRQGCRLILPSILTTSWISLASRSCTCRISTTAATASPSPHALRKCGNGRTLIQGTSRSSSWSRRRRESHGPEFK